MMADQSAAPQFTDADIDLPIGTRTPAIIRGGARSASPEFVPERALPRRGILAQIDRYVLIVVVLLVAIGTMMVYSATFDWSYQEFGSPTVIFMQHVRNLVIAVVVFLTAALVDYRMLKRFAVILLLVTIGSLIAVLVFGDNTFGARRAFFQGSYQPGEVAELTMLIYMAAWLGSKRTKVASFAFGLIPFMVLMGIVVVLVSLQPDLSTAATIIMVCGLMFFLAGANLTQLATVAAIVIAGGIIFSQRLDYTENRLDSFIAGLTDLSEANHHAQQAIIAFLNGGWFGRGLGQGLQKFGFLPAPHTDSIFAVIGEELGVVGASFVLLLYIVLVIRGLHIARRAPDMFGTLLATGVTLWIATKALLNIATMLSLIPTTGISLPFLSFGGSSLVVIMAGAGLLLSISRVTAKSNAPEGRSAGANYDRGWGNRWTRLSSTGGR
jgi:cell division protein FtsW